MIRLLDGLVLLKEVDSIQDAEYNSCMLRKMFPDKIVVIRNTSYIYKDVLCEVAQKAITSLDNYIQLGEFAERACIKKEVFTDRMDFMQHNNATDLFKYIKIANIYFLWIDEEFKYLLENYQPFYANLKNRDLVRVKLLGDLKIGFY